MERLRSPSRPGVRRPLCLDGRVPPNLRPLAPRLRLGRVAGHERRGFWIAFALASWTLAQALVRARMKQPLVLVTLPYAAGVVLGNFIPLPPYPLLAIAFCMLMVAFAWERARCFLLWLLLSLL